MLVGLYQMASVLKVRELPPARGVMVFNKEALKIRPLLLPLPQCTQENSSWSMLASLLQANTYVQHRSDHLV